MEKDTLSQLLEQTPDPIIAILPEGQVQLFTLAINAVARERLPRIEGLGERRPGTLTEASIAFEKRNGE
jgi:hypothetical protein